MSEQEKKIEKANEQKPAEQTKKSQWQIQADSQAPYDPLLSCLFVVTKLHEKPVSPRTIIAGLPLINNKLTPDLVSRAAKRASLSAKVVKTRLGLIKNSALPAILLLEDEDACVLTKIDGDEYDIIQPQSGDGHSTMSREELQKMYTGYACFPKPLYRFDERATEPSKPRPKAWFWGVVGGFWPTYTEVLLASFLINLFAVALPLFIMNVYDRVVPNQAIETLWALALGILMVIGFEFILRTLRGYFVDAAAKKIDMQLSSSTYEQLLDLDMANRPKSVGALSNTIHSFESFREFITSATINLVVDLPFTIIFLLVIFSIGGWLVLVPLVTMPLVIIINLLMQFPLEKYIRESYRHSGEKQALLFESLANIEAVKTFLVESSMQKRWEKITEASARNSVKLRSYLNFGINLAIFMQHFSTIAVVVGGVYLIGQGLLTVGGLIACTILTGRAVAPVSQLAGLINRYRQSKTSLDGLDQIMKAPVERPEGQSFLHREKLKGAVEFKDVSFAYPGSPILALNKVNFKINPGERVGIIGRMGSGKSTLAKVILKLYHPDSGSVLIDDTEINQIDPAEIRHQIGYVPQEITLFHGTIKENLVVSAPYVDDDIVLEASHLSGLERFVNQHPQGFDRQVGEHGDELSGGQRQTIALGRALLLSPNLLLFDEPTNFMDDSATKYFIDQLHTYMKGRTLIMVTHKMSMLNLIDRLIVMDAGQIIADGPKDMVIKKLQQKPTKPVKPKLATADAPTVEQKGKNE